MPRLVVLQPTLTSAPCGACKTLYGATCCERKTDDPQFPLTYGEASRIAKHTKQDLQEAVSVVQVSKDLKAWWVKHYVEYADLIVGNVGLYLPMDNDHCRYLGPNGCTIPQVKPYACATFPFSRGANGWKDEWEVGKLVQTTGFCIGQDANSGDFKKTLEVFGEMIPHLDAIARRRDRDVRVHAAQMRQLERKR